MCDASKLHGLGFILTQQAASGPPRIIQCGSRALTATERNYAIIELELLAIIWAISKCSYFLKGIPMPFKVKTNHRPLVGIFKKSMDSIDNSRLVRMSEKIMDYNFTVACVRGKANVVADALSHSARPPDPRPGGMPMRACILAPNKDLDIAGEAKSFPTC